MGIFDKFKKEKVIDYTDQYKYSIRKKPLQLTSKIAAQNQTQDSSPLNFLTDFAQASQTQTNSSNQGIEIFNSQLSQLNPDDRKEKLKQRLLNMTTQLEDLSNQLYRLQQRVEFLEQKLKTRGDYLG
ncbi:MAG: hypothetical protein AABY22_04160 [Nanoarchaeota archaeon]